MQQYIPGADSPENNQMAKAAYDQFMKVLDQDPKNNVAIASIASLYLNEKKWDDAQQWYEKLTAVDPNNPTPTTAWASSPGPSGIRLTARPAPNWA